MLFSELLRRGFDVYGTVRGALPMNKYRHRILDNVNALDISSVVSSIDVLMPDVVINAIGYIRQYSDENQKLHCIQINAAFPHMLLKECKARDIRCIHYSTDGIFNGNAGVPYTEQDRPTALDVYGLTKYLGEIDSASALTIRTSIIGPELRGKHSLLEWFLVQDGTVHGFTKAIYTGLPASEHARILAEYILPCGSLHGIYHVSAQPISKYELLSLLAQVYEKRIDIIQDDSVQTDMRLSCEAFKAITGYVAPSWPEMISAMREAHAYSASLWN